MFADFAFIMHTLIINDSQANYATEEQARIIAKKLLDRECGTLFGLLYYHEDTGYIYSINIIGKFGEVREDIE